MGEDTMDVGAEGEEDYEWGWDGDIVGDADGGVRTCSLACFFASRFLSPPHLPAPPLFSPEIFLIVFLLLPLFLFLFPSSSHLYPILLHSSNWVGWFPVISNVIESPAARPQPGISPLSDPPTPNIVTIKQA